jgi:hypothetical protein
MPFQTKIRKARLVYSGFSSEQMRQIGQSLLDSIGARIRRAENVEDAPAKPLKPGRVTARGQQTLGYPDYKARRGYNPVRDWISFIANPRGRMKTLAAMQVKEASENRVVIGFIDPKADMIAHLNQLRERQFGVSPKDRVVLIGAVRSERIGHSTVKWAA